MNEDKGTRYRRLERGLRAAAVASAATVMVMTTVSSLPSTLRSAGLRIADALAVPTGPATVWLSGTLVLAAIGALAGLAAFPFAARRQGALARRFGLPVVAPGLVFRRGLRRGIAWVLVGSTAWTLFAAVAARQPWLAGLVTAVTILAGAAVAMLAAPWLIVLSPRVRPVRDEALTGRMHALSARAGIRLAGLHEWVSGQDDGPGNAALVGVLGPRRLLVADSLVEASAPEEVDAIVAHELGHHVHGHTWRRVKRDGVSISVAVLAAHAAAAGPAQWIGGAVDLTDAAALPWMLCGGGLAWLVLRPSRLAQSRAHEAEADAFALALTGRPDVLERVLARIGARALASDDESLLTRAFFLTHPSIPSRIAAARRAADLNRGSAASR